jgi:hypothetical protein
VRRSLPERHNVSSSASLLSRPGLCLHTCGAESAHQLCSRAAPRNLDLGAGAFPDEYGGHELVLYGHRNNATLNTDGWPTPTIVGRTIGVDTISHGVLTAVRLPDQRIFQSARHKVLDSDV